MPSNSAHRYFLLVDQKIIDFPDYLGFKDMTSFKSLSFFTSLFDDEQDLIAGLDNLGLISPSLLEEDIHIVLIKRTGNRKMGYSFSYLPNSILYKSAFRFLSRKSTEDFLIENRTNRSIIKKFLDIYIEEKRRLIEIFEKKLEELEEQLYSTPHNARSKIDKVIESRTNSLVNFKISLSNLDEMLNLLSLMDLTDSYDRKLEMEYRSRVGNFIDSETHYIKGSNRAKNYRGLVKLAIRIDEFLKSYPELKVPLKDQSHLSEKIAALNNYKRAVEINKDISELPIERKTDRNEDEQQQDPDSYIYIEPDDFQRLITETTSPKIIESIAVDMENHEVRKGSK